MKMLSGASYLLFFVVRFSSSLVILPNTGKVHLKSVSKILSRNFWWNALIQSTLRDHMPIIDPDKAMSNGSVLKSLTGTIPTDIPKEQLHSLIDFIRTRKNILCITGAGVSTSSGIPDYRGPQGSYNKGHKPMVHDTYMTNELARKKYWGRSLYGWEKFSHARPNNCHIALNLLQRMGHISLIVTQNVDRLHQKSGSKNVVDLHGRNDQLKCMSCNHQLPREIMQESLKQNNQNFLDYVESLHLSDESTRADGDTELGAIDFDVLNIPNCPKCDGILKPNVVFFGDNVPVNVVEDIFNKVNQSDGILVIGTSLEVFSGYRFVERANSLGIPIAIVNAGTTRAERKQLDNIVLKVEGECSAIMKQVLHMMQH